MLAPPAGDFVLLNCSTRSSAVALKIGLASDSKAIFTRCCLGLGLDRLKKKFTTEIL